MFCVHSGECGGCQSIEQPYSDQLVAKQAYVVSALQVLGLPPENIFPVLPSESSVYYRNKMEFAFARKPTGELYLGLKRRGVFWDVIPLSHCYLQDPVTPYLLQFTSDYLCPSGLPAWDYRKREGVFRYLMVRQSKTTGHFLISLVVSEAQNMSFFEGYAAALVAKFPQVKSIVLTLQPTSSDTAFSTDMRVLVGEPILEEQLGALKFSISPTAFFQTNTRQAAVLYNEIVKSLNPEPEDVVMDLYCGTGTIGLYVAPYVSAVIGVEENPASIENAIQNARANGIANITFEVENVRRFLKFSKLQATKMIVDPPRDGLIPKVVRRVIERKPKTLVYVSCNLSTFIRDAKILTESGFEICGVQPVDMFPNTGHIEVVAQLRYSGVL